MKKIYILLLCLTASIMAFAEQQGSNDHFDVRLGWSVGGTMPIGMPEEIRSLNSYKLQPSIQFGADYEHKFCDRWGIETGLTFDYKAMETDAKVKNYHMIMEQKGATPIEGNFTGNVITEAGLWQMTVPVRATFWAHDKVKVKFGPYVAFAFCTEGTFKGYAYDGYLREGDPTGSRIEIGNTENTRGNYDFGEYMRSVNWGLALGADWYIGKRLGVYADLTWGMNGAFHSNFKTIEQTMYPVYGTVGAVYRLK